MKILPHLASRVIGAPLMVERARMETILSVIGPRVGVDVSGAIPGMLIPATSKPEITVPYGKIAVVPIHGTLVKRVGQVEAASGLMSYAMIEEMFMEAATDPSVAAIIMDIDSPGGEVGGAFDLASTIVEARKIKPVWAVADNAFSAAYLLASAAERIYLPQTAGVGSIGVIAVHVDESVRDAQEGLTYSTVFAGERKNDMSSHAPLSDSAHATLQAEVDRIYGMFTSAVAVNRGMDPGAVKATEAGIFFGSNAVDVGLADQIGTLSTALAELYAMTNQQEQKMEQPPKTVEPVNHQQQFQAQAAGIVDLCALANAPHLAGEFIAKGMSEGEVRTHLLSMRASSPEINSQITREQGSNTNNETNLETNPVVLACRKRAGV
ncbi:MAG: S49 family peptidase [Magnetococcales bacterium]|nr:S49 family peptidase [Magnetococcales bacterium]